MKEQIQLPVPAERQLLHPIHIGQARAVYIRGWWFARLGSILVAVALGSVIWLLNNNLIPALLAALTTYAIGIAAGRWYTARAWDFVPRKRQLQRDGMGWRMGAAGIDAVALVAATIAFVLVAHAHRVPLAVLVFALGAVVVIGLLQGGELVYLATRTATRRDALPKIVMLIAVVISGLIAVLIGIGTAWHPQLVRVALLGGGTVLLAQTLWWVFDVSRRRQDATARPRCPQ
ncbi:hypothetical protein [Auritidibacter sp. NML120636]|uniref:hypothetical protein n=1 Tax=Auritidibacter sp. NML120636 TaxID=2170743 RepID=UPI0011B23440|nr:hypothetical protein [Auritidibacter sp. NML120636]